MFSLSFWFAISHQLAVELVGAEGLCSAAERPRTHGGPSSSVVRVVLHEGIVGNICLSSVADLRLISSHSLHRFQIGTPLQIFLGPTCWYQVLAVVSFYSFSILLFLLPEPADHDEFVCATQSAILGTRTKPNPAPDVAANTCNARSHPVERSDQTQDEKTIRKLTFLTVSILAQLSWSPSWLVMSGALSKSKATEGYQQKSSAHRACHYGHGEQSLESR